MRSIFPDKMPTWLKPLIVLLFVVSWIPLAMIAQDRATPSNEPRVSIIPDMDKQEKFTAQAANPMFKDGRAMRPLVAGTVQYGRAHQDPWMYRGIKGGSWATDFPIKPNELMMARGQRQYNIYCSVCHGMSGYGNGMVAVRADALLEGTWTPPANLHDKLVSGRAPGHIFNTITNGIRNMPPYGTQITPEDRWAIVLYVKALQRSQNASINDVTNVAEHTRLMDRRQGEIQREEMEAQRARESEEAAKRQAADDAAAHKLLQTLKDLRKRSASAVGEEQEAIGLQIVEVNQQLKALGAAEEPVTEPKGDPATTPSTHDHSTHEEPGTTEPETTPHAEGTE